MAFLSDPLWASARLRNPRVAENTVKQDVPASSCSRRGGAGAVRGATRGAVLRGAGRGGSPAAPRGLLHHNVMPLSIWNGVPAACLKRPVLKPPWHLRVVLRWQLSARFILNIQAAIKGCLHLPSLHWYQVTGNFNLNVLERETRGFCLDHSSLPSACFLWKRDAEGCLPYLPFLPPYGRFPNVFMYLS